MEILKDKKFIRLMKVILFTLLTTIVPYLIGRYEMINEVKNNKKPFTMLDMWGIGLVQVCGIVIVVYLILYLLRCAYTYVMEGAFRP